MKNNSKEVSTMENHSVENIEVIYETPSPEIQESQINALVKLFNGLLKKSA